MDAIIDAMKTMAEDSRSWPDGRIRLCPVEVDASSEPRVSGTSYAKAGTCDHVPAFSYGTSRRYHVPAHPSARRRRLASSRRLAVAPGLGAGVDAESYRLLAEWRRALWD